MHCTSPRRGYTWIELVVILIIVGLLVGLLIPFVLSSREAARRTECQNNLKQIGLGFQNMESAIKRFPPSCQVGKDEAGKITSMDGWSWLVYILPYMECKTLFPGLNFEGGLPLDGSAPHKNALATVITEFHCPSFSGDPFVDPATETEAITNYKAMGATHIESLNVASLNPTTPRYAPDPPASSDPKRHPDGGIFPGSTHGINGFRTDGTAHTMLVVETKEQNVARWTVGRETCLVGLPPVVTFAEEYGYWHPRGYQPNKHFELSTTPATIDKTYLQWDYDAHPYDDGGVGIPSTKASGPIRYGPSSDHPGVTNHVFADGSVQCIPDRIDAALYMFVITRNGGDPVQSEDP